MPTFSDLVALVKSKLRISKDSSKNDDGNESNEDLKDLMKHGVQVGRGSRWGENVAVNFSL